MSRVVHHRDGSKTVTFANGNKVRFGATKNKSRASITGTPYVFAPGPKVELPDGVAHGMIFEQRGKLYVALHYRGKDAIGRHASACYGQPIRLTRPLR